MMYFSSATSINENGDDEVNHDPEGPGDKDFAHFTMSLLVI
jgi:hypothetical protein